MIKREELIKKIKKAEEEYIDEGAIPYQGYYTHGGRIFWGYTYDEHGNTQTEVTVKHIMSLKFARRLIQMGGTVDNNSIIYYHSGASLRKAASLKEIVYDNDLTTFLAILTKKDLPLPDPII